MTSTSYSIDARLLRQLPAALLLFSLSCTPPPDMPMDACKGRVLGDLVITELMIDPDGTDTGAEWFEVFNTLGTPIDLRGYTITYRQGTSTAKSHTVRASVSAPARGYVALGDVQVVSAEPTEFNDGCLGFGRPDESCIQVITPGWIVILDVGGQTYEAHTDETGQQVRLAPSM